MTWWALEASARSFFCSPETRVMTVAPCARAICTPAAPRPEPAPGMTTVSPATSLPAPRSPRQAVAPATGTAASSASRAESWAATSTTVQLRAGTDTSSAMPPSRVEPMVWKAEQ